MTIIPGTIDSPIAECPYAAHAAERASPPRANHSGIGPIPHNDNAPIILHGPSTSKNGLMGIPKGLIKGAATLSVPSSIGTNPSPINVKNVPGTMDGESNAFTIVLGVGIDMVENTVEMYRRLF